ncbi:arrestin domain-containing protein 3-like [Engraulis encrasicolus]|uniref:arrestin domain-containing protein 3-like n=1 Tax=Engraulis encrasicolus TaxID=184585 RepID=UPI002FD4D5ED
MSFTIKSLSISYDEINESNTFTRGDCISGHVTLEVAKETEINSFEIKAKGKASVSWSESALPMRDYYYDFEAYFKLTQDLMQETKALDSNTIKPGRHIFPFSFQLPDEHYPPSFKGVHCKIVYYLEAKLTRSMRIPSKARAEFTVVSKLDPNHRSVPHVQQEFKEEKLKLFNSGSVSMHISIDNTEYSLGDGITVTGHFQNNSSRPVKPTYCLYQKQICFASKERKVNTRDILTEEGDPVESSSSANVTRVLSIPTNVPTTVLNSNILAIEYRLRVYLDVKYGFGPVIKFDVELLAPRQGPGQRALPQDEDDSAMGASGGQSQEESYTFSYSDPPPAYEEYDIYPSSTDALLKK